MADDSLVTLDLQRGREIVDLLTREGFPLKAAAWVHESANDGWRLNLVTPIRNNDVLDAYLRASQAILADPIKKDDLKRVSFNIVDSRAPLGKKLVQWAKSTNAGYQRVSDASPEGKVIDAVVYGRAA